MRKICIMCGKEIHPQRLAMRPIVQTCSTKCVQDHQVFLRTEGRHLTKEARFELLMERLRERGIAA